MRLCCSVGKGTKTVHPSFKQKRIEDYANSGTAERFLFQLYREYVSECPELAIAKNVFYLTPKRVFKHSDNGKSITQQMNGVLANEVA